MILPTPPQFSQGVLSTTKKLLLLMRFIMKVKLIQNKQGHWPGKGLSFTLPSLLRKTEFRWIEDSKNPRATKKRVLFVFVQNSSRKPAPGRKPPSHK